MSATRPKVSSGFSDPVHLSQLAFRELLQATSQPGIVVTLSGAPGESPPGLSPAMTAICRTLLDFETSVWLDPTASRAGRFLAFHCGCAVTEDSGTADFAVLGDPNGLIDRDRFRIGSDEYPERGATVVIEVGGLTGGTGEGLVGPGIKGVRHLTVNGVADGLWEIVRANAATFPCGIDLLLTCGDQAAALPRSVRLED